MSSEMRQIIPRAHTHTSTHTQMERGRERERRREGERERTLLVVRPSKGRDVTGGVAVALLQTVECVIIKSYASRGGACVMIMRGGIRRRWMIQAEVALQGGGQREREREREGRERRTWKC